MRSATLGLLVLCSAVALGARTRADDWPQFRGPNRDGISRETGLLHKWPAGGPKVLWTTDACQGYAAAAIHSGRVYFEDYDREAKEYLVRCLTLADGKELWRFKESKTLRPNHGITRAVPAVDDQHVFTLDPKCIFHCLDAKTGREVWRKDLVETYKTEIPPWYNGQCPLIEPDRVVIGVGGDAVLVALDKATGNEIWRTPNPEKWPLAHSSVMPATLGGVKQYVWCTLFGPLGVRAEDGKLLWHHDRKFNVAVATSPLPIGDDRVFMTAGYDAGSVMVRVAKDAGGEFKPQTVFELTTEQWNSEVHTPILFDQHMFAVGKKQRGLFTCLDLDGQAVWTSADQAFFGLGSYLLADGLFFVLEGDTGMLRLLDANTTAYRELDHAQLLAGDNVWGPMALSNGKLVLRDMTKMICIDVAGQTTSSSASAWGEALGITVLRAATTPGPTPRIVLCSAAEDRVPSATTADALRMGYRKVRVIDAKGDGPGQFADELRGLAIRGDELYAVGDSHVVVFSLEGKVQRTWKTERPGTAVAVAPDGAVYVGEEGQIEIFERDGRLRDSWRDADRFGLVTAIGFAGDAVLIADVGDRCIRRYDKSGKFQANIGRDSHKRGFMLPNRHLDFVVDPNGLILAANPGQHRIERYSSSGELLGQFGQFSETDPAGFPGCCNPTNLALGPRGEIVVTEKAAPRVKVYTSGGELLAVMGEADFDPNCKNMDVAVDARGRVYVADTERLQIVVFEATTATSHSVSAPASRGSQP